jgi:hypothetical protein
MKPASKRRSTSGGLCSVGLGRERPFLKIPETKGPPQWVGLDLETVRFHEDEFYQRCTTRRWVVR